MGEALKVALLTNANSPNPGNWALTNGTKNLLKNHFGKDTSFTTIAWDDITFGNSIFDDSFFTQVNECDLFWVVGAVTFNGRAEHTRGGCRLNFSYEDLERIKVPIVLGGVSYRHWPNQEYHNAELLYQLLENLTSRSKCLVGIRNDDTSKWLRRTIGFNSAKTVEFPDPGFFALSHKQLRFENNHHLTVSMNNEDRESRFINDSNLEEFNNTIILLCNEFWKTFDELVKFAPHSFEDFRLFESVFSCLPKQKLHQQTNVLPIFSGNRVLDFYLEYSRSRLVLASRVHSMSPSIGMGVPTMVLSSQSRISEYMKKIGLQRYLIEFNDLDFKKYYILELMNELLTKPERAVDDFRKVREKQQEEITSILEKVSAML